LRALATFKELKRLEQASLKSPKDFSKLADYGLALFDAGFPDKALKILSGIPKASQQHSTAVELVKGHCLSAIGALGDAEASYRRLLQASSPDIQAIAFWSLADLKRPVLTETDQAHIHTLVKTHPKSDLNYLALFALGTLLDQNQDHDLAFQVFQLANRAVAALRPYDPMTYLERLQNLAQGSRPLPSSDQTPTPVFIVGVPRSGSTLLEQILSVHPSIEATHELPFIDTLMQSSEFQDAHALDNNNQLVDDLRAMYFEYVSHYYAGSPKVFTDKWLDNFWHAPMVFKLFPEARMVSVSRGVADNIMGLFRQYFATGNAFAFDLKAALHFISLTLSATEQLQRQYPDQFRLIDYELLVTNTATVTAQLFDFLSVKTAAPASLPANLSGAIMTPSGQQLRQGISTDYLNRSTPYLKHLAPYQKQIDILEARRYALLAG